MHMFFPAETITHQFVIPFAANEIDKVIFSYKQQDAVMFEKIITTGFVAEEDHVTSVDFQLTQGEGLLFADDTDFTVQVNVFTKAGTRHTSHELRSSTGAQYLRETIRPEQLSITTQPVNWVVGTIGETATFSVKAEGACRYTWQYRVNEGEWKACTNGSRETLEVITTEERINTHQYRCVLMDLYGTEETTNTVQFEYTDRGDE